MSDLPSLLSAAYDDLVQAIDVAGQEDLSGAPRDLRRAMERFVQALRDDPAASAELDRRVRFVAQETKPGTDYAKARSKARVPTKNQPKLPASLPEPPSFLKGYDLASTLKAIQKEDRFLAGQLEQEQHLLEMVLTQPALSKERESLAAWLAQSEAVEDAAKHLEADGCQNLAHPDDVMVTDFVLAGIKRAAALLTELIEGVDSPPVEVLVELSAQHREILQYLWKQGNATFRKLESEIWRNNVVEPATVQRAVQRLINRLFELKADFIVDMKGEHVILKRPDKK